MRISFKLLFIVCANVFIIVNCAKNGTESDKNEKRVPSAEFESDKSEIEFGRSVGDETDSDGAYYDDYDQGNEVSEREVTKSGSAPDGKALPTEVFLTMRNLTEEAENLRNFKKRNDVEDLQASASDNVHVNDSTNNTAWNSRTYRDARYPVELGELPLQTVLLPYQHTKVDTADLSDCARQGEWRPIGEIHIDSSQQNLQQEHDYLIPGSNSEQNNYGLVGDGFVGGDHDAHSSFQTFYHNRPVQNSFAEFQKLTADAASAHSGSSGFDLNQHLQKHVAGSVSSNLGSDVGGFGIHGGAGFNNLYKHTAGNVLSYAQDSLDFGKFPPNHNFHGHGGFSGHGDFGNGGGGGGTKFYHGQSNLNFGAGLSGNHKQRQPGQGLYSSGAFGSASFVKHKPTNGYMRYAPNSFQFNRKPAQNNIGDGYLSFPPKPHFSKGKKPGQPWKTQKVKTRRPNFDNIGSSYSTGNFFSGGSHSGGSLSGGLLLGGSHSGGSHSGGSLSDGLVSGGSYSGGLLSGGLHSGGSHFGGSLSGGSHSGGSLSGGSLSDGLHSGGSHFGGSLSGGSHSGGSLSGGLVSGGSYSGGSHSGGSLSGGSLSDGLHPGGSLSDGLVSGGSYSGGSLSGGLHSGGSYSGGSLSGGSHSGGLLSDGLVSGGSYSGGSLSGGSHSGGSYSGGSHSGGSHSGGSYSGGSYSGGSLSGGSISGGSHSGGSFYIGAQDSGGSHSGGGFYTGGQDSGYLGTIYGGAISAGGLITSSVDGGGVPTGGHAESLALASSAALTGSNVGHITHEAILQDASQLTSFTCGKNHDHGTNYHTASFQVSDDDHGSQDVLQYQDDAHVIIHAANNGFEDVLPAERKQLDDGDESSSAASKESNPEIITGKIKGASNHRYPEGGHNDENSGTTDQIEEPSSHNYFREGTKFSSTENSPIQFGHTQYEKTYSEPSSEKPKILKELEDLSSRFQLELDQKTSPFTNGKGISYSTFYTDETGGDKFKDPSHGSVIHNGFSIVNVNDFEINPKDGQFRYEEGDVITEYPYYSIHHESSPGPENFHSLPVVIAEHHPAREEKPKAHIPPKRKQPGKNYEVHENSGEKHKPATEIFPPQKFPRQFHNPMPNLAGARPSKINYFSDKYPVYGNFPVRPVQLKKYKKYKTIPGKLKYRRPVVVRRPAAESIRITPAPVVRVSVSS